MTISNQQKHTNLLPTTALHQVNCENTPLFWILSAVTASNKHPLIHEKNFSLLVDLGQVPPPLLGSVPANFPSFISSVSIDQTTEICA